MNEIHEGHCPESENISKIFYIMCLFIPKSFAIQKFFKTWSTLLAAMTSVRPKSALSQSPVKRVTVMSLYYSRMPNNSPRTIIAYEFGLVLKIIIFSISAVEMKIFELATDGVQVQKR